MRVESLSDRQLLSHTIELTNREREVTLRVLEHLNEIERRKLHLKLGFSSMFTYCTRELGYSESAAVRRIRSARCAARYHEVYEMLARNDVNLATLSLAARVLRPHNKDTLLNRIRGCSQAQVKRIVAEYEPRPMPRDVIQPVVTRGVAAAAAETPLLAVALPVAAGGNHDAVPVAGPAAGMEPCETSDYRRSGGGPDALAPARHVGVGGAAFNETRTKLSFAASDAFMRKFARIRALAWHRLGPNPSLEQVFELAMDRFLDREDPRARQARREKRAVRREASGGEEPARGARQVPAAVRDQVFLRDRGCCTFVGSSGRPCRATDGLQIDHVVPVARGGAGVPGNLRLLCASHNRFEAERLLGATRPRGRSGRTE